MLGNRDEDQSRVPSLQDTDHHGTEAFAYLQGLIGIYLRGLTGVSLSSCPCACVGKLQCMPGVFMSKLFANQVNRLIDT